jgi:serine/threonine protein kinase
VQKGSSATLVQTLKCLSNDRGTPLPPFQPPLDAAELDQAFQERYTSLSVLKSGGQGAVFKASASPTHPNAANTTVALKIYYADQLEERAQREVDALRLINSDVIVRVVDTGRVDLRGLPCVWLETAFIEGEPVAAIASRGPVSLQIAAAIGHDIALAIEELWRHRIVHRDIKPDNIMLRPDGHAVLIDLGVARHTALQSLTTHGKTWGTEGYLSPEQCRALHSLTCKSDIFGLGIVIQEALLGRHPTGRRQGPLVLGGASTGTLVPSVPPEFSMLVDRMLSRDPVRRPNPAEVVERLRPFTA